MSTYVIQTKYFKNSQTCFKVFVNLLVTLCLQVVANLEWCENAECVMNDVNNTEDMLSKPILLCPICLRKLEVVGLLPDVKLSLTKLLVLFEENQENQGNTECRIHDVEREIRTLRTWLSRQ